LRENVREREEGGGVNVRKHVFSYFLLYSFALDFAGMVHSTNLLTYLFMAFHTTSADRYQSVRWMERYSPAGDHH